jgi:hypothetical protein
MTLLRLHEKHHLRAKAAAGEVGDSKGVSIDEREEWDDCSGSNAAGRSMSGNNDYRG